MELSTSAQRVQDALKALGMNLEVLEMPASTRTAVEAAQVAGCTVGQIVKSLVFRALESDRPILVETSGTNRVDEAILAEHVGEAIGKADADFVRLRTGFAIGGVPPVGHLEEITTFIDRDLLQYKEIWAAAGTPRAVFRLTPQELVKITGGKVVRVT
ncbi:MAG: YbaK/EbsC family protein [Anaerolineales bacterium]|nr:YbaK/EbsC family protein [Anaerolineales bacterium]